jgi:CRP-like cAMP-binding protein
MVAEPAVAWMLLRRLAERVRVLVDRLDRLALQSSTTRLASFLLTRIEADDPVVTLDMTQTALAAELGTVREVVVRSLRELREGGLVVPAGRGKLHVVDLDGLRRLATLDEG